MDVTVTMTYYIGGGGRTATFVLRDKAGRNLSEVEGMQRGDQPLTLESPPPTGSIPYPSYEVVTIDGAMEVIEHQRMEPLFYITDDPEVKRRLGVLP